MKTIYIILAMILAIQSVSGQNRIAEKVSFKSGEETITGILVKPNSGNNLPAVVFQQGSGNFAFDGYENEAWGPHKFYIEDVLLENSAGQGRIMTVRKVGGKRQIEPVPNMNDELVRAVIR